MPCVQVVPRSSMFHAFAALAFLASLPMLVVAGLYLAILLPFLAVASLPFTLLNGRARGALRNNFRLLGTAMGRSSLPFPGYVWGDIVTDVVALAHLRGFLQFWTALPMTLTVLPVLKYCVYMNPFLHKLEEMHINQWSPPHPSTPAEYLQEAFGRFISSVNDTPADKPIKADVPFIVHYPAAPHGRTSR